jgi:hypothetical protein
MKEIFYTTDIGEAEQFEAGLGPGDYFVGVDLAAPLSVSVNDISDYLVERGIDLRRIKLVGSQLQIYYHKPAPEEGVGFAWAALIPLIAPLVITGAVVFGILKIGDITKALVPLILVTGGVVILVAVAVGREAVTEAVRKF